MWVSLTFCLWVGVTRVIWATSFITLMSAFIRAVSPVRLQSSGTRAIVLATSSFSLILLCETEDKMEWCSTYKNFTLHTAWSEGVWPKSLSSSWGHLYRINGKPFFISFWASGLFFTMSFLYIKEIWNVGNITEKNVKTYLVRGIQVPLTSNLCWFCSSHQQAGKAGADSVEVPNWLLGLSSDTPSATLLSICPDHQYTNLLRRRGSDPWQIWCLASNATGAILAW